MKKIKLLIVLVCVFGMKTISAQNYIGIVGDATTLGYAPEGIPLIQDSQNPNIFTYEGVLKPGKFKFHLKEDDWCIGSWINAAVVDQDLSATDYITTTGCNGPDNQWGVSVSGSYSIVIDLGLESITISTLDYFPNLYLVGDATPNGWDINNATPLVKDTENPAVFTWTGNLIPGEFKITTAKSFDGGWNWIHPVTQGQDLTLTNYEVLASGVGNDYKWVIDTEGSYTINLNLQSEVISIESNTALSLDDILQYNLSKNILNFELENIKNASISVFDSKGMLLTHKKINKTNNSINLSEINASGVLILRLLNNNIIKTSKVLMQ